MCIRDRLYAAYGGDAAGLTAGICFGDTALLSDNASDSLAGAGLSHLTAVSGLHMTIIAGAVYGLLRLLRVPKRAAAGINILAMLFFMGVTLFPVSAVRAGMMQIVMMLGYVLSRKADGLNSLGLALLLLVLFQPYAACDPGLLLSFAATLGLLTVLPWLRRSPWLRRMERRRILGKAAASLAVSFAALAFTVPIIGLCFGEVSLMSPLSNLLAIPAAAADVYKRQVWSWRIPSGNVPFAIRRYRIPGIPMTTRSPSLFPTSWIYLSRRIIGDLPRRSSPCCWLCPPPFAWLATWPTPRARDGLCWWWEPPPCCGYSLCRLFLSAAMPCCSCLLYTSPEAVETFLQEYKASVEKAAADLEGTAALCESYGIIPKAAVAKQAIPRCNLVYIDGAEMKAQIAGYFDVLYAANPKSVGGAVPDEAFYYGA